ncbi:MAG TPA: ankyrin repeat domain-containing protein [Arcobacter sp.]|nr:ankyrin repeat domain-containing protein [Arcobacter sp.]
MRLFPKIIILISLVGSLGYTKPISKLEILTTSDEYENVIFFLSSQKKQTYSISIDFKPLNNTYSIKFKGNNIFLKKVRKNLLNYRQVLSKIPKTQKTNNFNSPKVMLELKLHIMNNDLKKIKKTILKLNNINFSYKNSYTPIYYAISSGNIKIVELLLKNGTDVNYLNIDYLTPLHHAVIFGDLEIVRLLLTYKADVNAQDKQGLTPLHYAADLGYKDIIYLLQAKGANQNIQDFGGLSPRF